ncbi:MAG TPA: SEL1-like repeat protein [Gemmata sp.]
MARPRFPGRRIAAVLIAVAVYLPAARSEGTDEPGEGAEVPLDSLVARAAKGDTRAQMDLAYRYRDGTGTKRDYAEAVRWAHRAADRGDPGARFHRLDVLRGARG